MIGDGDGDADQAIETGEEADEAGEEVDKAVEEADEPVEEADEAGEEAEEDDKADKAGERELASGQTNHTKTTARPAPSPILEGRQGGGQWKWQCRWN